MCVDLPIQSIGTKLRNLENMPNLMIYLTSRDTKTLRRSKVMAQPYFYGFFHGFGDIDIWPILKKCMKLSRHEVQESPFEVS